MKLQKFTVHKKNSSLKHNLKQSCLKSHYEPHVTTTHKICELERTDGSINLEENLILQPRS